MASTDSGFGFDDSAETRLAVDSYIRTTASGPDRCVIFDRSGIGDMEGLERWLSADEGWYVDLRDMR
ncbi:MAG: hypothetical protein ACI8U4_000909 [Natronomonas sp.]|jgi:hypothetical protein